MKIQSLAIIFIIIVLPMSIILSEYLQVQMNTIKLQTLYDSKLISSTYDAVRAFQLNSLNSASNDITSSKIRDIEASANVFLSSMATNFGESGISKSGIKSYIPAIVYCLYDGYYIYSPYTNDIGEDVQARLDNAVAEAREREDDNFNPSYYNGQQLTGLKPYIYYSCRYVKGSIDVVITYSLDNYITIQGKVGSDYWNESGYFLDGAAVSDDVVTYNGVQIDEIESTLREVIYDPESGTRTVYPYAKVSGTKYYCDLPKYQDGDPETKSIFYMMNGEKSYAQSELQEDEEYYYNRIMENKNAYNFYKKAAEFTAKVRTGLGTLTYADAKDEKNEPITDNEGNPINGLSGNNYIFNETKAGVNAEDTNSDFTEHRTAVIRHVIEKNLTAAIANYNNNYAAGSAAFAMPNLSETDWYKIINNISVITFLQGMPIGGKEYNGYAVVVNNKNEDYVGRESIYISDTSEYHRYNDNDLLDKTSGLRGYFNLDFERHTYDQVNYFYPRPEYGCYTSIVTQTGVSNLEYDEFLKDLKNKNKTYLLKVYYTALGREKYSMFRVNAIDER